jgi:hypothetical protein
VSDLSDAFARVSAHPLGERKYVRELEYPSADGKAAPLKIKLG